MTDTQELLAATPANSMEKAAKLVELEAVAKQVKAQIDQYSAELLEETKRLDVLQIKTGTYTISRVKKLLPKVTDFASLKNELDKAGIPYDTVETFADHMKQTFKQIAEEGRKLNGLEVAESEYVMIRINKE